VIHKADYYMLMMQVETVHAAVAVVVSVGVLQVCESQWWKEY
jgi:hypothetical protein